MLLAMISVIIPVYNTGHYLIKCVDSIVNQTYRDLQIILINDGSTDDSLRIMQELADRDVRVEIVNRQHEGVSAARNAGLETARGDFISFIDSDDWLDVDTYRILLGVMAENDVDAVYYEWTEEYSDGTSTTKGHDGRKKIVLKDDEVILGYFKAHMPIRLSSGLLKRKLLEGVWFEIGRCRGEDMLVSFLSVANAKRIVYIDFPFYHRYHRVGSLSNQIGFDRNDFGRATCTDVMVEYIERNKPQLLQAAYCHSFNFYMVILNRISYYRCEKQHTDIYESVCKRLKKLWTLIDSPIRTLPVELGGAYAVYRINRTLYHYIMVIYYRYVKKELGGKRQR